MYEWSLQVSSLRLSNPKPWLYPDDITEALQGIFWEEITPGEANRLTALLIEKVIVYENKLSVELKCSGVKTLLEELTNAEESN